ncbi:hypothetical protein [Nostoc sp. WHI]|uniref:hypothetical protein n=1 Tax=Nostoc sp. WHI TaxID=2650611 RepID=UPI0018C6752E|nr:hypothetical protein [Nostoc sp. WHI]
MKQGTGVKTAGCRISNEAIAQRMKLSLSTISHLFSQLEYTNSTETELQQYESRYIQQ